MLTGALLLMAQPASAAPALPDSPGCPASTIVFAPPFDTPLVLTRRIERPLTDGTFTQTVTYRISFFRAGRGTRMRWQQTGQSVQGPPELLRLLSLEDEAAAGEVLDFTLDATGMVLGVSESPDASARLGRAIDRLRVDPALAVRPPTERARISAMLDRLAALPANERAAMHLAKAARLLLVAGRPCSDGQAMAADGSRLRIESRDADALMLAGSNDEVRPDGARISSLVAATLSLRTGLLEIHDRQTSTQVAGTRRLSRETLTLQPSAESPKSKR